MRSNEKMKQWLSKRNNKIDTLLQRYEKIASKKKYTHEEFLEIKILRQEFNGLTLHKKMQKLFEFNSIHDESHSLENIFAYVENNLIDLIVDLLNYYAKRRGKVEKNIKDVSPPKQIRKDKKQLEKSIEIIYKYCDVFDGYGGLNLKSNVGSYGALSYLRGITEDANKVLEIFTSRRYNTEKLATLDLKYIDYKALASLLFAQREDQIEVELRGILNLMQEVGIIVTDQIKIDLKTILQYIHPQKKQYKQKKKIDNNI